MSDAVVVLVSLGLWLLLTVFLLFWVVLLVAAVGLQVRRIWRWSARFAEPDECDAS